MNRKLFGSRPLPTKATYTPKIRLTDPSKAWTVVIPYEPSPNLLGIPGRMNITKELIITIKTKTNLCELELLHDVQKYSDLPFK